MNYIYTLRLWFHSGESPHTTPLSFSHWAFIFSSLTKINVDNFINFFQLNIFTSCFTCHHRWRREKERKEQKMEGDPSFSPYKPVYWTGKQHRYVFVHFLHLKRVCLTVCWKGCDLKSVFILCFFFVCLFFFCRQGIFQHLWETAYRTTSLPSFLRDQTETPAMHPAAGCDGKHARTHDLHRPLFYICIKNIIFFF